MTHIISALPLSIAMMMLETPSSVAGVYVGYATDAESSPDVQEERRERRARHEDRWDRDPAAGFWDFQAFYSYPNIRISGLPETIRNVPIHRRDHRDNGSQGAIDDQAFSKRHSLAFGIGRFWWLEGHLARYAFGIRTTVYAPVGNGIYAPNSNGIARRNYTNAVGSMERGEGAALTYVRIVQRGPFSFSPWPIPVLDKLSPELEFQVGPKGGFVRHFAMGFTVSYYAVAAEAGWDRYDTLQPYRSRNIRHDFPITWQLSYKPVWDRDPDDEHVAFPHFNVGVRVMPHVLARTGEAIAGRDSQGVSSNSISVFASLGFGLRTAPVSPR